MEIIVFVALIAIAILFFVKKKADEKTVSAAEKPVALHAVHGSGTCEAPDWQKVKSLFVQAIRDGGQDPKEYLDYVNGGKGNENVRSHYIRYGATYPAHVSPC